MLQNLNSLWKMKEESPRFLEGYVCISSRGPLPPLDLELYSRAAQALHGYHSLPVVQIARSLRQGVRRTDVLTAHYVTKVCVWGRLGLGAWGWGWRLGLWARPSLLLHCCNNTHTDKHIFVEKCYPGGVAYFSVDFDIIFYYIILLFLKT